MHKVVLILGSNRGEREALLSYAVRKIEERIGKIVRLSRVYETVPWGSFTVQEGAQESHTPNFLNQALVVQTELSPEQVLDTVQRIEQELGRPKHTSDHREDGKRTYRDRTIDIDILFYDDSIVDTERLQIPHPEIAHRRFVLEPLSEICPDYVHPVLKISVKDLFNSFLLNDSK